MFFLIYRILGPSRFLKLSTPARKQLGSKSDKVDRLDKDPKPKKDPKDPKPLQTS